MLELGVNIDHVATLRQARYRGARRGEPDIVAAARDCLRAGARGITAHLREDRRHIQNEDIERLRAEPGLRLNFELANEAEIIDIALRIRPAAVCLVPEKREELTTEGGLDVASSPEAIRAAALRLRDQGVEVSLFIDPAPEQVEAAAKTGAEFVELHTGAFAEAHAAGSDWETELRRLQDAAAAARQAGLRVNAGHGINYDNLGLVTSVPHLEELNIGHAIVSRAMFDGLYRSVSEMMRLMRASAGGAQSQ